MKTETLDDIIRFVDSQWADHIELSNNLKKDRRPIPQDEVHIICAGIYLQMSEKLKALRQTRLL